MKILPVDAVLDRTGLSRRTLYQEVAQGRFPRPVQLTARRVGWPDSDVDEWLAAKVAERDQMEVADAVAS